MERESRWDATVRHEGELSSTAVPRSTVLGPHRERALDLYSNRGPPELAQSRSVLQELALSGTAAAARKDLESAAEAVGAAEGQPRSTPTFPWGHRKVPAKVQLTPRNDVFPWKRRLQLKASWWKRHGSRGRPKGKR